MSRLKSFLKTLKKYARMTVESLFKYFLSHCIWPTVFTFFSASTLAILLSAINKVSHSAMAFYIVFALFFIAGFACSIYIPRSKKLKKELQKYSELKPDLSVNYMFRYGLYWDKKLDPYCPKCLDPFPLLRKYQSAEKLLIKPPNGYNQRFYCSICPASLNSYPLLKKEDRDNLKKLPFTPGNRSA